MDITNTPKSDSADTAIAAEARELSDYMQDPAPETETRRQAREAAMRNMATKLLGGERLD